MAGSYPDVPARRIAYHVDGSLCGRRASSSGVPVVWNTAQMSYLNSEQGTTALEQWENTFNFYGYFWHIFPEYRDLYGAYYRWDRGGTFSPLEVSDDTTNSVDGTWTSLGSYASYHNAASTELYYRTNIMTFNTTTNFPGGVRAIRLYATPGTGYQNNIRTTHLYGEITAGQTPNRMLYISQSTGLEYTLPIDWGDIPRGAVYDEDFYTKNNSSTLSAVNTTLTFDDLYKDSASFYTLSTGIGWSTSLGPVTVLPSSRYPASNYLTVRCDPPSTAQLGLHAAYIIMATSSWT